MPDETVMTAPGPEPNAGQLISDAPLMSLLDLAGRRWLLRIMWELREKPLRFTELRARCDHMSQSVLTKRLAEMTSAMLVSVDEDSRYQLTPLAGELVTITSALDQWAHQWAQRCAAHDRPTETVGNRNAC